MPFSIPICVAMAISIFLQTHVAAATQASSAAEAEEGSSPSPTETDEKAAQNSCPDCTARGTNPMPDTAMIVNGETVLPANKYPWTVALLDPETNLKMCGGAIINELYILTAAHCFLTTEKLARRIDNRTCADSYGKILPCYRGPQEVKVAFLTPSPSQVTTGQDVDAVLPHELFNPLATTDFEHDIALVRMRSPVQCGPSSSPICLPPPDMVFPEGSTFVITGWGSDKLLKSTPDLREAFVVNAKPEDCGKKESFHCVYGKQMAQSSCKGDSGGSLIAQDKGVFYTLGVLSNGDASCSPTLPFLYTSVPFHWDWVHQHVGTAPTQSAG